MPAAPSSQSVSLDFAAGPFRRAFESARALVATIRHSLFPTEEDVWLAETQLQLYRKSTRFTTLLMPPAGLLIADAASSWAPWSRCLVWWLILTAVSIGTYLIADRADRSEQRTLANVRFRACIYVGMTFLFLLSWGSMTIFLWAPNSVVDHMFLVLILACSLAGSIAVTSSHPAIAATVYVMHAAFIVGPLSLSGQPLDRTLSWLALIYVVLLGGQFYALNVSTSKLLRLVHERQDLVDKMRAASAASDRDRSRAMAAGRTRTQFLANMNHELRTPMNAILGFSELIRNKSFGEAVDKYADYAAIIHDSGRQLLGLIDNMFDLAKSERGRMGLRECEISVPQLIAETVATGEETARASQISLSRSIGPGIPRVWADERALRQIIVNLLSNALKFTQSGGCVVVFARLERNGRVAFGVEDTGVGISDEDQGDVFERFGSKRYDVTTANRGTGLGLAIVKGFAEAHEGEVKLESSIGMGTRVTVFIPVERTRLERYRVAG